MTKLRACMVLLFCAGAISSQAQTLTTLYSFCSQPNCADGSDPYFALAQGTDTEPDFYGTTLGTTDFNGSENGTIFRVSANGQINTLHEFCSMLDCAGWEPQGLVQSTDGAFYGVTTFGGSYAECSLGCGTVFRISPDGSFTTLYAFCEQPSCPDGYAPSGTLMQGADGNFYGTTAGGGTGSGPLCEGTGCGTVFRVTLTGA
jgi:uncharacterized repeat protein (TIGR03803 family)